jgi:thiamine pyrophosphate-dependent acetolactate synthase large subunit-like protein
MSRANLLERRNVVSALLAGRKDAVVIGGLGASTYDIAAAGDHDRNFYLWGGMGGAVMIGLGVALAQPNLPVVVITGDGEMLMGLGSLATVGLQKPGNLTIIVLDNEVYGETGGQASHTGANVDLAGPRFVSIKIDAANLDRVLASRDGSFIVTRIRGALGFGPI